MNLTLEEKENLAVMMQSSGWDAFEKLAQILYKNQERIVMNYNLMDGPEGLMIAKARAEGARKLLDGILSQRKRTIKEVR